jgi:hypothetical protein
MRSFLAGIVSLVVLTPSGANVDVAIGTAPLRLIEGRARPRVFTVTISGPTSGAFYRSRPRRRDQLKRPASLRMRRFWRSSARSILTL